MNSELSSFLSRGSRVPHSRRHPSAFEFRIQFTVRRHGRRQLIVTFFQPLPGVFHLVARVVSKVPLLSSR